MSNSITLYYLPASPPCRNVLLVGKILNLNFDKKLINIMEGEHLTPEFLKLNPEHTVPTINDNDLIVWESRPIMGYFVDMYAKDEKTASLYPKDPRKRVVVDQRLYFDVCNLYGSLAAYYGPILRGVDPKPDEAKKMKFLQALSTLDKFLENQEWVAGDEMTIADIAILVTVNTAEVIGIDVEKYDKVRNWLHKCREALEPHGYNDIEKSAVNLFGQFFKSRVSN